MSTTKRLFCFVKTLIILFAGEILYCFAYKSSILYISVTRYAEKNNPGKSKTATMLFSHLLFMT